MLKIRSGLCFSVCGISALAILAGCGGGGGGGSQNPPPAITVSVTPATASLNQGGTQTFTASVANDASNAGVTWSIGNGVGTLSASSTTSVTYTAPASIAAAATVTLSASSVASPGTSASAAITLNPPPPTITSVAAACVPTSVQTGATSQCTATVAGTGSFSTAVTWSVGGVAGGNSTLGTVSSAGVYTAPSAVPANNPVSITATSTEDTTKSGSTSVTLTSATPTITSVAAACVPTSVSAGATSQCTATVGGTGSYSSAVTWAVGGVAGGNSTLGTISSAGIYTAPSTIPATNPVTITATSTANTAKSGSATITVTAPPTITSVAAACVPTSVSVGATSQCTATVAGTGGYISAVTWSAGGVGGGNSNVGTISSAGLYSAPAAVPATNPVTITATSTANTAKSGSAQVTITAAAVAYTIGGTISGLTEGGLVLANGTGTVSPAANATSFVFPTAVASSASYSVTVKTQPSGLTCSVTNGSGTVASSDVTNVQVACTASADYTIGGVISGLTEGGLMLANGTDTVSPAANATSFVFPTPLVSGASYSVSVGAQPSGDSCIVTNGSGTVASSNVTNVQVACTTSTQTSVPLVVMPATLPIATSGTPYSKTLTASGTGPFTWSGYTIADGNSYLNPYPSNGMSLSSGGVASGTPFYTGLQPIAISVSRADGAYAFVQTELPIGGTGSSQSITNSPPAAAQGQSYLWELQASWGYTGSNQGCGPGAHLVFGSIPPGLTYNGLNSTAGTLFGTPTMAGTYTITFMADPGTTLCAPEPTNYKTVTLTVAPATSPSTPAGSSNWTRQGSTAVLTPSSSGWDSYLVGSPSVIKIGTTYYLYYEGINISSYTPAIGLATSTDGVHWTKGASAILQPTTGAWDSTEVRYPTVVQNGSNYLMVYQGSGTGSALGLATSTNGTSWTKHAGAVFTTSGVHSAYVPGSLLFISGQYVLYYTVDGDIGRMTSTDGVSWNDGGAVFSPSNSSVVFSRPAVIYDGAVYRMWYTRIADANDGTEGTSGLYSVTIGYADSPDGQTWTTHGNPIFTAGASGAWDRPGVGDPSVSYDGTTFRMWYVGGREELPGGTPDSDTWVEGSIGYALIP
jgi:predicted GH43/DUF377 family glycosyl hydrolase